MGCDPVSDDDQSDRLRRLEARIAAAKGTKDTKKHTDGHYSQAQLGWRMVTELVAGLGIGLLLGLGLDTLLGTMPIFLVIFTGLGFAAGVNVMLRTAREVQVADPGGEDMPAEEDDDEDWGENGPDPARSEDER